MSSWNISDSDTREEEKDAGEESLDEDSDEKDIYSGKVWEQFETSAKTVDDNSESNGMILGISFIYLLSKLLFKLTSFQKLCKI